MSILHRKYGLTESIKNTRPVQEELDYLQIPKAVQENVKVSLKLSGTGMSETLVHTFIIGTVCSWDRYLVSNLGKC